jgi:hypothetical protein
MSLFIHKENQSLLWELIQLSPHWNDFSALYNGHTQLWFKNIMSVFYDKYWNMYCQVPMTVDDLKKINKEVILYMTNDIRKTLFLQPTQVLRESETPTSFDLQSRMSLYDKPITAAQTQYEELKQTYDVTREKQEKAERAQKEFDEYQKRYSVGFEKKPPPPIDFSIQMDSERIKNMDELVQQQLAERERDLQGIPLANIQ